MKTLAVALSLVAVAFASADTPRILHALEPVDHRALACGCTGYMETPESMRDFYAGPEILILDPNGEPPNARVNLGAGNIMLSPAKPIEFPLYQCVADELWVSEWVSDLVTVRAELKALRSGEESCAFTGRVVVTRGSDNELAPINVACGC